jgi:hypothetical protein
MDVDSTIDENLKESLEPYIIEAGVYRHRVIAS